MARHLRWCRAPGKSLRAQGLATERRAVEAAWSPPVFMSGRTRLGTEGHGEWPQELMGRQRGGSDPQNLTRV